MKRIRKLTGVVLCIGLLFHFCSCGAVENQTESKGQTSFHADGKSAAKEQKFRIPEKIGATLTLEHSMELSYATGFSVDYYVRDTAEFAERTENAPEYKLLTIHGDAQYLLIPDGEEIPADIPEDMVILLAPHQIYLVASQVMDMFSALDAMDRLRFSALAEKDWYIEAAIERMKAGELFYAGKYAAPDYELLVKEGCDLAIENTMIYHSPQVKEKLESFGIPVMIDHSSYESEPLGRTEWVKLYGALTGCEEQAEEAFCRQVDSYQSIRTETVQKEKPTVAFFYIAANGSVKVRKSSDYLPKMIQMAGGEYIFSELGAEEKNASSTVNMQMEEFYAAAKDADYIIYNSTTTGELSGIEDFLQKHTLLANMKAVKENHVYCTSANLYQSTMELGTIIADIHKMLTGNEDMKYLFPLD